MRTILLSIIAVLTVILLRPEEAAACSQPIEVASESERALVARAGEAVRKGRYFEAVNLLVTAWPNFPAFPGTVNSLSIDRTISKWMHGAVLGALDDRIYVTASGLGAVAVIRTRGEIRLPGLRHAVGGAQSVHLAWAEAVLSSAGIGFLNMPIFTQVQGERLVQKYQYTEAIDILGRLAAEDQMADAHGYAALAVALDAVGRKEDALKARLSCRQKSPSHQLCGISDTEPRG